VFIVVCSLLRKKHQNSKSKEKNLDKKIKEKNSKREEK
jgi:hypothetical protein